MTDPTNSLSRNPLNRLDGTDEMPSGTEHSDETGSGTEAFSESTPDVIALAPEVLAESLGQYQRAWWLRIKGGESGALPILAGLVLIVVIFQVQNSHFLGPLNLVNLIGQSSFFILLGAAEMFALLLSEIDLSV